MASNRLVFPMPFLPAIPTTEAANEIFFCSKFRNQVSVISVREGKYRLLMDTKVVKSGIPPKSSCKISVRKLDSS